MENEAIHYLIKHKTQGHTMVVLVHAYKTGSMKRNWDIVGPSDEEGNLIDGATVKSKPQSAEEAAGAGAVGGELTLNQGTEESKAAAAKTWSKPKPTAVAVETPAQAEQKVPEGMTADGPFLLAEPGIAPQPENQSVKEMLADSAEAGLAGSPTKEASQAAAAVDAAVAEPANTPLPREVRKEVKLTDQLPPADAEKEAQARQHAGIADAAAPAPAEQQAPATTTRRRPTRNTNS